MVFIKLLFLIFNFCNFLEYLDLNAPDASDLLNEEAQRAGQSKIADAQAWSPYESKTVRLSYRTKFYSIIK